MKNKHILKAWYDFKSDMIFKSIAVGVLAGLVVIMYRFAIEKAMVLSRKTYAYLLEKPVLIPVWFIVLMIGGWLVGVIIKKEPMASGSGIPQVKGVLLDKLKMNWVSVALVKFFGGVLSILAGLSLGREGPSIQLGATMGQGFSRVFKQSKMEEKYLITSGASAGLAAAFNAPLAGVIFALEELHKNFSPNVMISALVASISADFMSKVFFGMNPVFHFDHIKPIPLDQYFHLIILGVAAGLLGILFNKSLIFFQDLYAKQKWLSPQARPIIPFVIAGALGLLLPQVLGGGHELVNGLIFENPTIAGLILLLVVKFVFTMVSYGSSAPGGIFLPLLVIGALIGNLYSITIGWIFQTQQAYTANFIILSMAAYFTAIVKAPITGIILLTEMTGSFSNLLSTGVVCLSAYIVTDLLKSKPIYDVLLERVLHKGTNGSDSDDHKKTLMEIPVHMGSEVDGKMIKEIPWPPSCLIVGILRGGREIIPHGNTILLPGDYLIVITNQGMVAAMKENLSSMTEKT